METVLQGFSFKVCLCFSLTAKQGQAFCYWHLGKGMCRTLLQHGRVVESCFCMTKYWLFYFDRCEKGVMSLVNVRNCIRFYQTAEELNASTLLNYCAEIIASHWVSTVRRKQEEKCLQRIGT